MQKFKSYFHKFKDYFSTVMDVVILAVCVILASALLSLSKSDQFTQMTFTKPKPTAKKTRIPKAEAIKGEAYKLVPKKTVHKYKTVYDAYGNSYQVKRKHPKISYHANFYLDPNAASKSDFVERPIYLLITGSVIDKPKTLLSTQTVLADSNLVFDMSKHFTLNDSVTYIYVMQFVSFKKYNNKYVPNAVTKAFTQTSVAGSKRYLKLSEFNLVRIKDVNLSQVAAGQQLFCGVA